MNTQQYNLISNHLFELMLRNPNTIIKWWEFIHKDNLISKYDFDMMFKKPMSLLWKITHPPKLTLKTKLYFELIYQETNKINKERDAL